MQMYALFGWSLFAGALTGPTLSLLGAQLAMRDRAMQTLCIAQGGTFGVLLGVGILQSTGRSGIWDLMPVILSFAAAAATYCATEAITRKRMASRNTFFSCVFALLIAAGHLISHAFPAMESHLSQIYLGDLATLSPQGAQIAASVAALCFAFVGIGWRRTTEASFELALFGETVQAKEARFFPWASLAMLAVGVQSLGFLFTISLLFIPTAILSRLGPLGVRYHLVACAGTSLIGTWVGFSLSLAYTRVPTVPAIACVTAIAALIASLFGARIKRQERCEA